MSQQADRILESALKDNEDGIPWDDAVQRIRTGCGVKENTAETYIRRSDKATTDVDLNGNKMVVDPAKSGETVVHDEDAVLEMEVGNATSRKFGDLTVLQDVGHPLVQSEHKDGYFRRRMGGKKTDVQVVTGTIEDPDFSTLLIGEAGVGKDRLLLHCFANANRPTIRLTANDDPDFVELLIGSYAPDESGNWERRKGLLQVSVEYGYGFILDEVNTLSGKVQTMLNMILEDADQNQLVIPETNEVIEPHPEFKFAATMNPAKVGYGGTEDLNQAFMSRFFPVKVPPLDETAEKQVVAQKTAWDKDDTELDILLSDNHGVITGIRSLYETGKITTWVSTRDVIKVGRMAQNLGDAREAADILLTGMASSEDVDAIRSAINDQNWP